MDPLLLDYYNKELVYMREMASEFARQHPKIAKRLGMHGIEVADPYVERLVEAFCFQSARMQIKLDAEFPRFTQRLLEVIYPNYVAPTPSMAVAQLMPTMARGALDSGFVVPRSTVFHSRPPAGESTACEFRSSQDVTLWPVVLTDARLTGVPPDIPALDRYLPPHVQVHGALRLRLKMLGDLPFSALKGLNRLPLYLSGDEFIASHLFELVHAAGVATLSGAPGTLARRPHVVSQRAVAHEGLEPEQSLLPLPWNTFHGHNLLHEYFACPSRFYFFALEGLAPALSAIDGNEAEIVVLLDRAPGALANQVDSRQFALFCTPVINLFPKRTERVEVNPRFTEFHLVPDRTRPLDYEVFSVGEVIGQRSSMSPELPFRPLYQTLNNDEGNYGRYFSMRREKRLISDSMRKYGSRTQYIGTETFLSLVDQREAPYAEDIRYLSVNALVTNRDLATLVPRNGVDDLVVSDSVPTASVGLVRSPTAPRAPFAERELAWRLIRQLGFNYMPLADMDHRSGGQGLRDLLRLFVTTNDGEQERQISCLVGSHVEPITRRLPGGGPLVYGRGVRCQLTVDETGFSGISPYLFGVVLEHYLARHVSINSFTETELQSMQRGLVKRWPVRIGQRNAV